MKKVIKIDYKISSDKKTEIIKEKRPVINCAFTFDLINRQLIMSTNDGVFDGLPLPQFNIETPGLIDPNTFNYLTSVSFSTYSTHLFHDLYETQPVKFKIVNNDAVNIFTGNITKVENILTVPNTYDTVYKVYNFTLVGVPLSD